MRRIKGIKEGNKEAMRQTQRKRYQREKIELMRKAKTEEQKKNY